MNRFAPSHPEPRRRAAAPWILHGLWAVAVVLLITAGLGLGGVLPFGEERTEGRMPGEPARLPFRPATPHNVPDPCPHGDFDAACREMVPEPEPPRHVTVTCLVVQPGEKPLMGATCSFDFGANVTAAVTGADGKASAEVPIGVLGNLSAYKPGYSSDLKTFDVTHPEEVRFVLYPAPVAD
ncbi:MAG TPA: hypothetical protein VI796_03365, partial [Candidatus Thermoplasmatota archaeon]|nr:hypothetical protein [Candidatus Thermoplasmatota archaeon]